MAHVYDAATKVGLDTHASTKFPDLARAAGFTAVKLEAFKLPLGGWPKDTRLKQAGVFMMATFRDGLQAIGMGFFTRVLGWTHAAGRGVPGGRAQGAGRPVRARAVERVSSPPRAPGLTSSVCR